MLIHKIIDIVLCLSVKYEKYKREAKEEEVRIEQEGGYFTTATQELGATRKLHYDINNKDLFVNTSTLSNLFSLFYS